VGDGHRKCVRCIGLWQCRQAEDDAYHLRDLQFLRPAIAGDRSFHEGWRILVHLQAAARTDEQGDPARVP
jgi:hypothetical protein